MTHERGAQEISPKIGRMDPRSADKAEGPKPFFSSLLALALARPHARAPQRARGIPAVPALRLDPRADAMSGAVAVRSAGVAPGEAVDAGESGIVLQRHHDAVQADVPVPVVGEDGHAHLRVLSHPLEPS